MRNHVELADWLAQTFIVNVTRAWQSPTFDDMYACLIGCPKSQSSPPTLDSDLPKLGEQLNLSEWQKLDQRVSWIRKKEWLFADVNGGVRLVQDPDPNLIRLYLNTRRSFYPIYIDKIVRLFATLDLKLRTKVCTLKSRWDNYDGITIYVRPYYFNQVLAAVRHNLDHKIFIRSTTSRVARQVFGGVYIAQEPDQRRTSFHGRIANAISSAIYESREVGALIIVPRQTRGGQLEGWSLEILSQATWHVQLGASLKNWGVDPNRIYLNLAIESEVRSAIWRSLGSL
ncbi:hypothetical protein HYW32_01520 [Candidatus Berkelbacteria bacterium]|nr:hypothetical protein [Candidatus Berkelbacteria bacterium]